MLLINSVEHYLDKLISNRLPYSDNYKNNPLLYYLNKYN